MPQDDKIPKPLRSKMARYMVSEILAHLGSAISQSLPTDDQIIMKHVHEARALANALFTALEADKQKRKQRKDDNDEAHEDEIDQPCPKCGERSNQNIELDLSVTPTECHCLICGTIYSEDDPAGRQTQK